jgi:hypothetical protein
LSRHVVRRSLQTGTPSMIHDAAAWGDHSAGLGLKQSGREHHNL